MTRRERMEQRAELRREWADKRAAKSAAAFEAARRVADGIPAGQPILVGHHSEGRHRRDVGRIESSMSAGVESARMAERHESKAASIERALDRSIFSDDADADARLRERIADRERQSDRMKLVNKAHAKFLKSGQMPDGLTDAEASLVRNYRPAYSWEPHPYPPYALANLRSLIAADRKRLAMLEQNRQRAAAAEAAPGGVTIEGSDYVRLTFADKPPREILQALKAAGFRWSAGSWWGYRAAMPAGIQA